MALTLIAETGTGSATANSYATVADGDAYHEGHVAATAWTSASSGQKAAALVMATRLIDACWRFQGVRAVGGQALAWPRSGVVDLENSGAGLAMAGGALAGSSSALAYFGADVVPVGVKNAACEMARELLVADRSGDAPGVGVVQESVTGFGTTIYDRNRPRAVLSRLVQVMLSPYGSGVGGGASVGGVVSVVRC